MAAHQPKVLGLENPISCKALTLNEPITAVNQHTAPVKWVATLPSKSARIWNDVHGMAERIEWMAQSFGDEKPPARSIQFVKTIIEKLEWHSRKNQVS